MEESHFSSVMRGSREVFLEVEEQQQEHVCAYYDGQYHIYNDHALPIK